MNVDTTLTLVNTLIALGERVLSASNLLKVTQAEGRQPTVAELHELDLIDDVERDALQKAIDDRRARDQAANGTKAGDVPMKVGAVMRPAPK